jgi:hypothetical protein
MNKPDPHVEMPATSDGDTTNLNVFRLGNVMVENRLTVGHDSESEEKVDFGVFDDQKTHFSTNFHRFHVHVPR